MRPRTRTTQPAWATDIDVCDRTGLLANNQLGDARVRVDAGPLHAVRAVARLRRGPGGQHVRPDHRRHRPRRLDADRQPGQLERHADDHLRVPVAALRRRRQQLREHPGRHRLELHAGPRRRRRTLRVVVTAINAAGSSTPAASAPTGTVSQLAPSNIAAPGRQRHARDGQTLTATIGTWTGTAPLDYAVPVAALRRAGANCADIAGATAATYVLTGADVGATCASWSPRPTPPARDAPLEPPAPRSPSPPANTVAPAALRHRARRPDADRRPPAPGPARAPIDLRPTSGSAATPPAPTAPTSPARPAPPTRSTGATSATPCASW